MKMSLVGALIFMFAGHWATARCSWMSFVGKAWGIVPDRYRNQPAAMLYNY